MLWPLPFLPMIVGLRPSASALPEPYRQLHRLKNSTFALKKATRW